MHTQQKGREGATSPGPVYMSPHQMTDYLQDLRNNRPARPTGSRPPPAHFNTWSSRTSSVRFADSQSLPQSPDSATPTTANPPNAAPPKHKRSTSEMSIDDVLASAGRPLVQPPRGRDVSISSTIRERTPSVQYRENGRRQSERLEARAVRIAMEEMDLKSEQNLYETARDEAAELVWKHINPDASTRNPSAPYPYPTKNGSSDRSRSLGRGEQDLQRANSKLRKRHSIGSSAGSRSSSLQSHRSTSASSVTANAPFSTSPVKTSFNEKKEESAVLPKVSSVGAGSHKRRSSGSKRKTSASLFKNPDDQIYEEPEEEQPKPAPAPAPAPIPTAANPLPSAKMPLGMRRNPFARVQFSRDNNLTRSNTDPVVVGKRFDRYEIQKNPPSQSRNAAYTSNPSIPRTSEENKSDAENTDIKFKEGKEIRSDELRAATGFKLKDRSAKLPTPTMVSDSPGRPIVSFQQDWKPREIEMKEEISTLPGATSSPRPLKSAAQGPRPLSKASTAPVVPTVASLEEVQDRKDLAFAVPTSKDNSSRTLPLATQVNRAQVPSISAYEDPRTRPLPSTAPRKVNTPPQTTRSPVPTINVSQTPPTLSKSSPTPPIPTISIQETPHVSNNAPGRRSGVKTPSASVTPAIPTISVSELSSPADRKRNVAPQIPVSTPAVPTISVNDSYMSDRSTKINAPSISITPSVPAINVNGSSGSTRPLPDPKTARKSFASRNNSTVNSRSHWTPTSVRTGVLCEQCALPIAGRIVSAGGSRFHPECFVCHHCGEHLECVAFYPEPESSRAARIARIRARENGEDIEILPSHPTLEDMQRLEAEDAHDESLRFYCHLDFHEFFSPRCKSCKTPIEGEVVVACGAEWHPGHFFCAQCGDPFDSSTPFVEKEGYAWCVGCHTNRYSTKCRKCKRPVTETVVKALGHEWHVGCFCCVECSGPFDDGRYFLRGESQDPVCVKCEDRRLKA
ncbi:hypothetical protein DM02DRAFT_510821 [Periconia macrospinosa]|uniref:LIM zinc-binding domain-containing protein n=1 Tax=Periconia macrospinosa TaxID=97972 RepID=A0A2V1EFK8_9PLEO|nr:hypothetical protein DM02DRAFT_510821 [Periconia macrospinosa]